MKKLDDLQSSFNQDAEINMSPLVDMVFLLLIFFMVTSVFVEETGVEVDQPQAASISDLEKSSILLALNSQGQIFYGGREISLYSLNSLVSSLIAREKLPLILICDKKTDAEFIIDVIDECRLAGVEKISLGAQAE